MLSKRKILKIESDLLTCIQKPIQEGKEFTELEEKAYEAYSAIQELRLAVEQSEEGRTIPRVEPENSTLVYKERLDSPDEILRQQLELLSKVSTKVMPEDLPEISNSMANLRSYLP